MLAALFVLCLAAAAYPVLIYPLLVAGVARLRPRPWRSAAIAEPVAHIITVHNEQARIGEKLENSLSLEPPRGGLVTIVADDGSTDRTREIVETYRHRGVIWLGCARQGKERTQLEAIRLSGAPVLVFSDASTALLPDAVVELIKPFADPSVGAVSGTDRVSHGTGGTGEDLYVRYEMGLRRAESLAGSLVGLSGCLFAVRREIAENLQPDVPSDMGSALLAMQRGQRAVAQDSAVCVYTTAPEVEREFQRKRRTALRGLRCLWAYRRALGSAGPLVAWQVLSHKWLRFAVPLFAFAAAIALAVAALARQTWAMLLIATVLSVVLVALAAMGIPRLRRLSPFRALSFLLVSSAAVVAAWSDLVRGQTQVHWTPSSRPGGR